MNNGAPLQHICVIQTAFIGDVILATALLEKLHAHYPEARLDMVVRKGNEGLLKGHPFLNEVIVWDKSRKYASMLQTIVKLRRVGYDLMVNVQRFASSGIITMRSGGKRKVGFDANPIARFFDEAFPHVIGQKGDQNFKHETDRNQQLIAKETDGKAARPRLYPTEADYAKVKPEQDAPYVCMAPASVWYTKQWQEERWVELIAKIKDKRIYLIGAPSDKELCDRLAATSESAFSLAGQLNLLQSAALMQGAIMNYTNDSAPMHMASAVNAPVTAIYCSTVPEFGFGPLSDQRTVWQTKEDLACRPCGLHGHRACPEGHFKCSLGIAIPDGV